MANTITTRTLQGGGDSKNLWLMVNISSDGSEETNLVVYDNSAFVNNVLKGNLVGVWATGSACTLSLVWDQTPDSPIINLNPQNSPHWCFKEFGGIGNPGATGATGDILLITSDLDAGDKVTLIMHIWQN